ncbi:MAG TPA: group II intron reverse transcriptase/maturase [Kofleriaceae bacterium]|nr:group II intron reverse transcriptase/maturase [Kofleriaceae bacterium]
MNDATTSGRMSPELLKVAERAKRHPEQRILALAHLIDEPALERAHRSLRKGAAVGVDGVTVEQYGERLAENLQTLRARMRAGQYRHQPIRRVNIPKENGTSRPIGISTVEDKIVQGALRDVLEAIYEQDFLDCSYGFRPNRSAHGAIRQLNEVMYRGDASYIVEADIVSFFDSIDRKMLMEMLRNRIADESLMRLVGKCLHVGVLDGERYLEPDEGTAQGSSLSPLLGNIYLHHVLDVWFEREVQPQLRGRSTLVRYADDFALCFERADDAQQVWGVLEERFKKFGLALHPKKTRSFSFQAPRDGDGSGGATFDFLGFTLHWQRARKPGTWRVAFRTRGARLRRAIKAATEWCRRHRHDPVKEQHLALTRKLNGHYNYFGVNGNLGSLRRLCFAVERIWQKWLNRRSQRARMSWKRFQQLIQANPLPAPKIKVQIWGLRESVRQKSRMV